MGAYKQILKLGLQTEQDFRKKETEETHYT